jgi:hypothetical protein
MVFLIIFLFVFRPRVDYFGMFNIFYQSYEMPFSPRFSLLLMLFEITTFFPGKILFLTPAQLHLVSSKMQTEGIVSVNENIIIEIQQLFNVFRVDMNI